MILSFNNFRCIVSHRIISGVYNQFQENQLKPAVRIRSITDCSICSHLLFLLIYFRKRTWPKLLIIYTIIAAASGTNNRKRKIKKYSYHWHDCEWVRSNLCRINHNTIIYNSNGLIFKLIKWNSKWLEGNSFGCWYKIRSGKHTTSLQCVIWQINSLNPIRSPDKYFDAKFLLFLLVIHIERYTRQGIRLFE